MKETLHFKRGTAEFESLDPPTGVAEVSRLVGPGISDTMGAGLVRFDGCSLDWTVLYDEMIVVLEGELRLTIGDRLIVAGPGDFVWIPKDTPLRYEGTKALACFALCPGDWKSRQAAR